VNEGDEVTSVVHGEGSYKRGRVRVPGKKLYPKLSVAMGGH